MTGNVRRPARFGIAAQIIALSAVSVLIGVVLVIAVALLVLEPPEDSPALGVARIADVTRFIRAAKDPHDVESVLATVRGSGVKVEIVPLTALEPAPGRRKSLSFSARMVLRELARQRDVSLIDDARYGEAASTQVITRLDDDEALVFEELPRSSIWPLVLTPTIVVLIIVLILALLLSVYAARAIIRPLSDVARAAAAFGRSAQAGEVLEGRGPREIVQVSEALNEMRARIRALLDDRTRMLAAISHDLRTPLTRLRLRSERIGPGELKAAMLRDIDQVSRMLDETLDYLRDDSKAEAVGRIELSSLLETICSDFADVGHDVSYAGPDRLVYECRPRALTRAVTNVVENAVKHGDKVVVELAALADGFAIDVVDDGPGIPAAMQARALEPFVKLDQARASVGSTGFGLGLSIAQEIMKKHDGSVTLLANEPSGLRVRLFLPSCAIPPHVVTEPPAKVA